MIEAGYLEIILSVVFYTDTPSNGEMGEQRRLVEKVLLSYSSQDERTKFLAAGILR